MDNAAQQALGNALRCRIDRSDPAKVNRYFLVIFDHLKFGMVHANSFAPQFRLSENDQLLPGRDHLLHVMQIEPAQGERLTQSIRVRFLQRGLKDFFPAAESKHPRLGHFAAQTDRRIAFLAREFRKLMPIFVAPREMREQIFRRPDAKSTKCQDLRPGNPLQFVEALRDFHHLGGGRRGDLVDCASQSRTLSSSGRALIRLARPSAAK